MICILPLLAACGNDDNGGDNGGPEKKAGRTVIVYMAAENNLSGCTVGDLTEMTQGSRNISPADNLIAFVDAQGPEARPYIIRISDGKRTEDTGYNTDKNEFYASDPQKMKKALEYIMTKYPAEEYGLVLWGHAGGWLIEPDTISGSKPHRAYGYDSGRDIQGGNGGKWINIPTLAKVLGDLPHGFRFIFADCCNFQCAEVAYELREVTDYIIGSPAEIPDVGAPYDKLLPYLFDRSEEFYKNIVDTYFDQIYYGFRVPLSVIKTSEMENLAAATAAVIRSLADNGPIVLEDSTYYYRGVQIRSDWFSTMTDINDALSGNIKSSEAYTEWKDVLDRAVTYRKWTGRWITVGLLDYGYTGGIMHTRFRDDGTRYGGMSMFFPQPEFDLYNTVYNYNELINRMQWYYAAGVDYYYNNVIKAGQ